jgi:multidrug efflux pump subunit AcrB
MVRHTVFANLGIVLILVTGILSFFSMSRELMPETSFDIVTVTVAYPGADPEEVEEGVCIKIEEAIEGLEGVKRYTTIAAENVGVAQIECKEGYTGADVKEDVRDRIDQITTFPDAAEKPRVTEITNRLLVLLLSFYGDCSERDLKETAERAKRELTDLPEISQVTVGAVREYEIVIDVSEERLTQFSLSFAAVAGAVRKASLNLPGGTLKAKGEEIRIRCLGRHYTGKEFASTVVVASPEGARIPLDRIAKVRDGFEETPIRSRFMGKPTSLVTVFKTKEEDVIAISDAVDRFLPELERTLPPGMKVVKWANLSKMVHQRIDLLTRNGILGLTFVFLMLWLFLDLRLGFWVSLGIPVSIGGAMAILALQGQTVNMLSLFSLILVLGIVVDDAIVVGEAVYHHRRSGKGAMDAAVSGVTEVSWPVIAAVATTIIAFVPLFLVGGGMGKLIWIVPLGVIAALSVSLVECLFLLPAHLNHLPDMRVERPFTGVLSLPSKLRRGFANFFESFVENYYGPFLSRLLAWRYVLFASVIFLLLVSVGLIGGGFVKFTFFPSLDNDFLVAQVEFPDGTTADTTAAAVDRMEAGLERAGKRLDERQAGDEPLVRYSSSVVGAFTGFNQASGAHLGEVYVELLGSEVRNVPAKDLLALWEEEVGPIPGAISAGYESRSPHPGGMPIEVWILGENLPALRLAAKDLRDHLATIKGVLSIEDDFRPGKRELIIKLKPEALPLGLAMSDLATQLRSGFYGLEADRIQRGAEDIRVWVRYPKGGRDSISDLDGVRIRTPLGVEVPLKTVAEWTLSEGVSRVTRKDGRRRIVVTADVDEAQANSREILEIMQEEFFPSFKSRHPGVTYTLEGQQQESQEAMADLMKGFSLVVIAMFLILATIFRSYIQPFLILITVPFGLCGAVFSHFALGLDLTIMSMFGIVALSGIVVNDAIILIEAFNARMAEKLAFRDAVVEGAKRRFRPVVLTTLTTFVGLAPLMAETSFQAQFLIPMAVAIAFGVVFATVLTLLLLPCLLGILNDVRRGLHWVIWGKPVTAEEVEPRWGRGDGAGPEKNSGE